MHPLCLSRARRTITAAALLALAAPAAAQAQQDNVLIVIADDLGVDHVRVYGETTQSAPTPNLDALAARGVLFRNAWANPVCSPSRACLTTGRYSYRTGVGTAVPGGGELQQDEITLPEQLDLRGSGFAHAAIGKWHLTEARSGDDAPNRAGWSHYAGLLTGAILAPSTYFDWPRTVDGQTARSTTYATTKMVDDALAWIGQQRGPWVCWLAFNAPHSPFHAPPAALHTRNLTGLDPDTQPTPFYKAMVEAMDTELGRLFGALGPQLAHTHVIFLGDNGTPPQVTQPPFVRTHAKGTPYEGGVNVPLIVAGPAVASPGRESAALVGAVDVFATVLELCGVAGAPQFVRSDSVSFAPYLRDPALAALRAYAYAELFDGDADRSGFATARDASYKLIQRYSSQPTVEELYDLDADPFETSDLMRGALGAEARAHHDALSAEIARIRGATAGFEPYGTTGCTGSHGVPALAGTGMPRLGGSYSVRLTGAPPTTAVVLGIGGSAEYFGPLDLPFPLTLLGAGAGCWLFASLELTSGTATDAGGNASRTLQVPTDDVLLGGAVHHTWLVVDPAAPANPLGVVATSGLRARLGAP
jgi:arylsulfatase A-like enzyme